MPQDIWAVCAVTVTNENGAIDKQCHSNSDWIHYKRIHLSFCAKENKRTHEKCQWKWMRVKEYAFSCTANSIDTIKLNEFPFHKSYWFQYFSVSFKGIVCGIFCCCVYWILRKFARRKAYDARLKVARNSIPMRMAMWPEWKVQKKSFSAKNANDEIVRKIQIIRFVHWNSCWIEWARLSFSLRISLKVCIYLLRINNTRFTHSNGLTVFWRTKGKKSQHEKLFDEWNHNILVWCTYGAAGRMGQMKFRLYLAKWTMVMQSSVANGEEGRFLSKLPHNFIQQEVQIRFN